MSDDPLRPTAFELPSIPGKRHKFALKQERAAALIARDGLTVEEVAEQLDIAPLTITRWLSKPAFRQRVSALAESITEEILQVGIARKIERIKIYDDLMGRMQQIMAERAAYAAAHPELAAIPGMKTGLVVKQEKMIGSGASAQQITEYVFDESLFRSMQGVSKQISQELGQWIERRSVEGSVEHRVSLADLRAALRGEEAPKVIEGEAHEVPSPELDPHG